MMFVFCNNVFQQDFPEKQSKLVIDVAANKDSAITAALEKLDQLKGKTTTVEKINIKMPDVDLTKHLPAGKDIVSTFTLCRPPPPHPALSSVLPTCCSVHLSNLHHQWLSSRLTLRVSQ
jgi:hypothetical protein